VSHKISYGFYNDTNPGSIPRQVHLLSLAALFCFPSTGNSNQALQLQHPPTDLSRWDPEGATNFAFKPEATDEKAATSGDKDKDQKDD
jgi:hypothetical protein